MTRTAAGFTGNLAGSQLAHTAQFKMDERNHMNQTSPISNPGHAEKQRTLDIGLFTKIPSKFFSSGLAAELKPSAAILYLALCEHANRENSNQFKASDRALASETSLSERTISSSRKILEGKSIITCSRDKGQSYSYKLERLKLTWRPLKERIRQKRKARARQSGKEVDDYLNQRMTSLADEAENISDANLAKRFPPLANYATPYRNKN